MTELLYDLLADLTALVHAALLLFDFVGAFAVVANRFSRWPLRSWQVAYLLLAGIKSFAIVAYRNCPLTRLEQLLRRMGALATSFDCSYIEHYLPWLPTSVDQAATLLLMTASFAAYLEAVWAWRRLMAFPSSMGQQSGGSQ